MRELKRQAKALHTNVGATTTGTVFSPVAGQPFGLHFLAKCALSTGSATFQLMGSADNSNFSTLATYTFALSTTLNQDLVMVDSPTTYFRVDVSTVNVVNATLSCYAMLYKWS